MFPSTCILYFKPAWSGSDVIIMYIYHVLIIALRAHMIHINLNILINALSAHMIHSNLNIFYTHVEHSPIPPTKTIYIKYYMETHTHTHAALNSNVHDTDLYHTCTCTHTHTHTHTLTHSHTHECSRNWVLILFAVKIWRAEEGFQSGFKRWQGWALFKVLWVWIPNVGSKAREGVKAMSLAFVLLDFHYFSMHVNKEHV